MKITYNEKENSLEIKDGIKKQYFILKLLMVLNLINALVRLIDVNKSEFGFIEFIWLTLGILSLILLYFFIFKRSTAQKIEIDKIKGLKEKSAFGRKRFYLELSDGKQRNLLSFKNEFEFAKIRELLTHVGIEN